MQDIAHFPSPQLSLEKAGIVANAEAPQVHQPPSDAYGPWELHASVSGDVQTQKLPGG